MTAITETGPYLGQRHLQVVLMFAAIVVNFFARMSASVAVVAMTNSAIANPEFKEYNWSIKQRSYILSSFYWGYILTQLLGGFLCRRYGAHITIFISTFASTTLTLLPPFCVSWGGWQIYCVIRIIMGLFQGMFFSAIHVHLAKWCPPKERNRLGAVTYSGIDFGTLISMFASGAIAASSWGWPGISYVSGACGIVWSIFWLIFGANTPSESRFITQAERNYIENSKHTTGLPQNRPTPRIPVPWIAILTSSAFWALILIRAAQTWGYATIQLEIPAYLTGVLMMDMRTNAIYSALPFLASFVTSYLYLIIADVLIQKQLFSLSGLRKIFSTIASWIPAVCLIAVGFLSIEQTTLAVVLMILNIGINAANTIGSALNTIDLTPNHAGIVMGFVNTVASIMAVIVPLATAVVVNDEHNRVQWQTVFFIAAVVLFAGNLIYIVFGQMHVQPWDAADFLKKYDNQMEAGRKHIKKSNIINN